MAGGNRRGTTAMTRGKSAAVATSGVRFNWFAISVTIGAVAVAIGLVMFILEHPAGHFYSYVLVATPAPFAFFAGIKYALWSYRCRPGPFTSYRSCRLLRARLLASWFERHGAQHLESVKECIWKYVGPLELVNDCFVDGGRCVSICDRGCVLSAQIFVPGSHPVDDPGLAWAALGRIVVEHGWIRWTLRLENTRQSYVGIVPADRVEQLRSEMTGEWAWVSHDGTKGGEVCVRAEGGGIARRGGRSFLKFGGPQSCQGGTLTLTLDLFSGTLSINDECTVEVPRQAYRLAAGVICHDSRLRLVSTERCM